MPVSELLLIIYKSDKPGTKTEFPRVDTAPHGVETIADVRV